MAQDLPWGRIGALEATLTGIGHDEAVRNQSGEGNEIPPSVAMQGPTPHVYDLYPDFQQTRHARWQADMGATSRGGGGAPDALASQLRLQSRLGYRSLDACLKDCCRT